MGRSLVKITNNLELENSYSTPASALRWELGLCFRESLVDATRDIVISKIINERANR